MGDKFLLWLVSHPHICCKYALTWGRYYTPLQARFLMGEESKPSLASRLLCSVVLPHWDWRLYTNCYKMGCLHVQYFYLFKICVSSIFGLLNLRLFWFWSLNYAVAQQFITFVTVCTSTLSFLLTWMEIQNFRCKA